MKVTDYLLSGNGMSSPAFIFDEEVFANRVRHVKEALGEAIPLSYSIKANPFLLEILPKEIDKVEVCSPGELTICQKLGINPEKIIYSGVMKERTDITRAIEYGVGIMTAESILHARLENEVAKEKGCVKKVILRLTSGNQFGMSEEDILYLIQNKNDFPALDFIGLHYYSGTQKKKEKTISKDLAHLESFIEELHQKCEFIPQLVEYGPGMAVEYFDENYQDTDMQLLDTIAKMLKEFASKYPLGIEMGRFLASSCGTYITKAMDIKKNDDANYVICDGGIHHLKYYGQNMAMQIPPIQVYSGKDGNLVNKEDTIDYSLCGSLCTTADVLVREVSLPRLELGDYLTFGCCGAYSVTEGSVLFLSRMMPKIYLYSKERGFVCRREFICSDKLNVADDISEVY